MNPSLQYRSLQAPSIRIALISLGCAKNLVDSEVMLGSLVQQGMELTNDAEEADVVIVNTCGFIDAAKQESINTVLEANRLREEGNCKALIMAGCLTQRYPKELSAELPEVDAIVGLNEVPQIAEIIHEILDKQANPQRATRQEETAAALYWSGPTKYVPDFAAPRVRLTPQHTAYVKIAEGCNHPCSFCSIPRIRGRHRSRQPADILDEVRSLVEEGHVREINLISQDTTFYGKDLVRESAPTNSRLISGADKTPLCGLLRQIQDVPGDFWVRLLYTHPYHWSDELIDTIAACNKVCRYIDMPLQHISDPLLLSMKRETNGEYIRDLVRRIRAGVPGIALRSTFIVGFPGETETDFVELLDFLDEFQFERVGIFQYSQEDHTPAGNMGQQVPEEVKQERFDRAMTLQQRVSQKVLQTRIGDELRVLIDGYDEERRGYIARTEADAPDIDCQVFVEGHADIGSFAQVLITGANEYDLVASVSKATGDS